jgi:hypothetical protein
MWGTKKGDLLDALDQIARAAVISSHTIRRAKELLDDEPPKAVPDEDQRSSCERRFGHEAGENVSRLVRQVHRRSEPSRNRGVVADDPNGKVVAVAGQPERPKCLVSIPRGVWGATSPCVIAIAAETVHQQDTGARLSIGPGNLGKG